jgi:hypothetical protein
VFVYNECKKGGPQNKVLNGGVYNGFGYTDSPDFVLYKKLLGKETFPFAIQIKDEHRLGMSSHFGDPGQVMGEIWTLTPEQIIALDNYVLNTVQFDRVRVKVTVPFYPYKNKETDLDVSTTEAYMYVAREEFWKDQISDAEATKFFKKSPRIFCAKEYNNKETLNAYFVFDYDAELETAAF